MVHVSPVSNTFEKDLNSNFREIDVRFHTSEKANDQRFHEVDIRFERIDARFQAIETTLQGIQKQLKTLTWAMGIGFTILTVIMVMESA